MEAQITSVQGGADVSNFSYGQSIGGENLLVGRSSLGSQLLPELPVYLEQLVRERKTNDMIMLYVKDKFGIDFGKSTLKRYLKRLSIRRVNKGTPIALIQEAIQHEVGQVCLGGPGRYVGYRPMAVKLRTKHFLDVSRETVRQALNDVRPPQPFAAARNKPSAMQFCPGPNFRWAVDGHDKLQSFGIYIHCGIDVYSRKIMWLKAFTNNRQQELIGHYYVDAVRKFKVVPMYVTADFGFESNMVCMAQIGFWGTNDAQRRSYSTDNTPVERWWRTLKGLSTTTWREHFEYLRAVGQFSGDQIDRWALVGAYLPLIQADLDQSVAEYEVTGIRTQKGRVRPGGQPQNLYFYPEETGGYNCGLPVSDQDIESVRLAIDIPDMSAVSALPTDVRDIVDYWLLSNNVIVSRENVREVYLKLRSFLRDRILVS